MQPAAKMGDGQPSPLPSSLPVPRITMDFARRGSNTSIYALSPSPTFLAPKPPPSPGAISSCSSSEQYRRFFREGCKADADSRAQSPIAPAVLKETRPVILAQTDPLDFYFSLA